MLVLGMSVCPGKQFPGIVLISSSGSGDRKLKRSCPGTLIKIYLHVKAFPDLFLRSNWQIHSHICRKEYRLWVLRRVFSSGNEPQSSKQHTSSLFQKEVVFVDLLVLGPESWQTQFMWAEGYFSFEFLRLKYIIRSRDGWRGLVCVGRSLQWLLLFFFL